MDMVITIIMHDDMVIYSYIIHYHKLNGIIFYHIIIMYNTVWIQP